MSKCTSEYIWRDLFHKQNKIKDRQIITLHLNMDEFVDNQIVPKLLE